MFYRIILSIIVLFIFLSCISVTSTAAENEQPIKLEYLRQEINDRTDNFVREKAFKGTILVSYQGDILLKRAYGQVNIELGKKNTLKSRFMIASMTKQFTAMCILILEEREKLSTDDRLSKYLPELPQGDEITLHQLLTHRSGLPVILPGSRDNDYIKDYPGKTIKEKLDYGINSGDIRVYFNPPGSTFHYSDVNYMILAYVVEKVSGMSFEDFLQKNIFEPLKMDDSGVGYYPGENPMLAVGYGPGKNQLEPDLSCADLGSGAGSIYSTVEDMYKWDRSLYSERLVKKDTLNRMFTPYSDTYGYGWWFRETDKGKIPIHGGRLLNGAFSGFYVRNQHDDISIIILGNDGNHDDKKDYAIETNEFLMSF